MLGLFRIAIGVLFARHCDTPLFGVFRDAASRLVADISFSDC
jgi:hypothetical protein